MNKDIFVMNDTPESREILDNIAHFFSVMGERMDLDSELETLWLKCWELIETTELINPVDNSRRRYFNSGL